MTDKYKILRALSHETRLQIVELLNKGERPVWGLLRDVKCSPQVISKHLSVLREAGIVEDKKIGVEIFYRLKLESLVFMGKWFIQF
jgi:DNA-binding transcriptional ArsR family regulator